MWYIHATMGGFQNWIYVAGALLIAVLANSVSAVWASKDEKFSLWLVAVVLISPLVFITFGLVASRLGVAIGSATIDSLLTLSTIAVGLIIFGEWSKISPYQYLGIALVVIGIFFMQFPFKVGS
jgi:multidrug transporter EmrE-like cation transporter